MNWIHSFSTWSVAVATVSMTTALLLNRNCPVSSFQGMLFAEGYMDLARRQQMTLGREWFLICSEE
jgi:hypothetical protein